MRRFTLLVLLTMATTSQADTTVFTSGDTQVPLIELYTSEGCSSCPPAERWLNSLSDHDGLWTEFVPVAFHVDYWDYIGWEDRFAKSEYSQRQRNYIRQGAARAVYTPGVFSNGDEWLRWRRLEQPPVGKPSIGQLSVSVSDQQVAVFFTADKKEGNFTVSVSLLGSGLTTEVKAGENRGKSLSHDFVVLGMNSARLEPTAAGYKALLTLPATTETQGNRAIAAWVSPAGQLAPIQATGGYLP